MARQPLDVREWLEDMRRYNSRDADRATELLNLLGQAEASETIICKLIDREKTGDKDADEILDELNKFDSLGVWAERDATFMEFGDLDEKTLEKFARAYDKYEAQSFALSEICMAAGIIAKDDYTTDPLPLLRMFLPVD